MSLIRLTAAFTLVALLVSCQTTDVRDRGVVLKPEPLEISDFGTFRALIIGINGYKHWPVLQFAESDARDIREILISSYGFQPENVLSLIGSEATESRILNSLKSLLNQATGQDNILVYYAGHGQLDPLTDTGNWIPVDGELYDESSWIPFSVVRTLVTAEKVKAGRILIITDSCYGGALARSGPTPGKLNPEDSGYIESLKKVLGKKSRQTIASGGFEQVPDRSHFAELLKGALRMNPYPVIDMEFIFYTEVFPHLRLIGTQYPTMVRMVNGPEENGQFILVKDGATLDALNSEEGETDDRPDQTPKEPDAKTQADMEFWNEIKDSSDPEFLQEYLRQFPDGIFALIAQKRLDDLISPDQPSLRVPKLVGMNVKSALDILVGLGFKEGRITTENSGASDGTVLTQDPAPESPAADGALINLVVAKASEKLRMPQLIGSSRAKVADALAKYGLLIGKVAYVSPKEAGVKEAGIVVKQSPEQGIPVEPKTSVDLVFTQWELTVPDLADMPEERAVALIQKSGLTVGEIKRVQKGEVGKVIGQSPRAGTPVEPGAEILLYIASASPGKSLEAIAKSRNIVARTLNPSLAAPGLNSPSNGQVFGHYPRKTELSWNPVGGAVSYVVEAEFQSGSVWQPLFTQDGVGSTRYTFNFIGAQPGRWRVWAIDSHGKAGQRSGWWSFRYTR